MKEIPFCPDPFTFLGRDCDRFMTCCPGWMHESRFIYGEYDNLWEVWNHPILVEWREALLQGDYRWCQRCPNRFRVRDRDYPLPDEKPIMERPPITYQCLDDSRCNLKCPSCRNHINMAKPNKKTTINQVIRDFPGLQTIAMSMAGDPFVSPEMREFLQQPGEPDVILWSNGILLPGFWPKIKRKVTVAVISVDSATKEVYEYLRQPAKWEQIQYTLDFLKDLREREEILLLHLNMIVQVRNFREMPAFVQMCKDHAADVIMFTFIAPWNHITPEEWEYVNVANPLHPNHQELLEILQHPLMKLPGVDVGFVSEGAKELYGEMPSGTDYWGLEAIRYEVK